MKGMRISALYARNLLGIREMRIECGKITTIKGRNGSGKSSMLEAIKAGISGGDLAKMQHVGSEDAPEVVLVLNDGEYRVEREGKNTVVKQRVGNSAAYEEVRRPQSFLDGLFDKDLCNPIRFLNSSPNDRADLLLEVLPLELDSAALLDAIGDVGANVDTVLALATRKGHPLAILTSVREAIFDERQGVNRSEKEKRNTVASMEKTLPAKMPDVSPNGIAALEAERDELQATVANATAKMESVLTGMERAAAADHTAAEERVKGDFKTAAAKRRQKLEAEISVLKEAAEREIGVLREEAEAQCSALDEGLQAAHELAGKERVLRTASLVPFTERLGKLRADVATARAQLEETTRLQHTAELRDKFKADADSLLGRSEALTAGLEALDRFKAKLLEALPIKGLTVDGKDIRINSIPFDQLNFAQRARVAVQLAAIRAKTKKLPVLFVDGAECFDSEQLEIVLKEIEAAGCQSFLARVEDHDLEVKTEAPARRTVA